MLKNKPMISQVNLNQVSVNTIDTSSGIFIGTNFAHNWSSHRKNNYGFGTASNSIVTQNSSYVVDNDFVDTPIDNCPEIIIERVNDNHGNEINVTEININVLDSGAAVSVGENDLNGWSAHSKRNAGQGRFAGAIQNMMNSSVILDNDIIDTPINDLG